MAVMNRILMESVSKKTLEIFKETRLTKTQFCKKLEIPGSYLSALQNEKNWSKIPAWAWFFFQEINNRKLSFNDSGEIAYIYDGYTLEEVHGSCKTKAEEYAAKEKKMLIPKSTDIEDEHVGDMLVGKIKEGEGGTRYTTQEDVDMVLSYMMDVADIIMEVRKDELDRLIKIKKSIIRWRTKK